MKKNKLRPKKISVIVTTYNRAEYLRLCLACLLNQDYAGSWQIVVADDGSTDHTQEVIERARNAASELEIIHSWQEDKGFRRAGVLNLAVRSSDGDLLVILDNDCLPPSNFLSVYAAHTAFDRFYLGGVHKLSREFSLGILESGQPTDLEEFFCHAAMHSNQKSGSAKRIWRRYRKSKIYTWLGIGLPKIWGCNFAVNRDVLFAVNGLDENYEGYGQEDSDLRNRMVKKGFSPVCLHINAQAYHLWHPACPSAIQHDIGNASNRAYYKRRHVDAVCKNGLRKFPEESD